MFEIGQIVKFRLTGESVMILIIFPAMVSTNGVMYEIRMADFKKLQVFDFELESKAA